MSTQQPRACPGRGPLSDLPYADPGTPDTRSALRFLLWLQRSQRRGQLVAAAWGFAAMSSSGGLAVASGRAVQALVDRSRDDLATAVTWVALLGALTVLSDVMFSRAAVTNWITAAGRLQQLLSRKVAELGSRLERQLASGEVVAIGTSDVEKIGWFVEATARFGAACAACAAVAALLFATEPVLGLVVTAGVPLLAASSLPLLPAATRRAVEQRVRGGRAVQLASDIVAGLRVLRGIGGEDLYLAKYRGASQAVRRAAVRSARLSSVIVGQQVLLRGMFTATVLWCGTSLLQGHRMSVGDLVMSYSLVSFLMTPLAQFEEMATAWSVSRPAAQRAAHLLSLRREERECVPDDGRARGDLHDPATGLLASAGRLTAVVCDDPDTATRLVERLGGHSASGEDDDAPSALLGAVPLDSLPLAAVREKVLVQAKDPVLLSGTVRELLDVPRSGTVSAAEALAAAQCDDVLNSLAHTSKPPSQNPLAVHIVERGRSVSGGQRQRLALARSLVADPDVLILDEPTSAVDAYTEARIAESLAKIRAGRTTIVLTFSPLLLDRADRVLFLAGSRVKASGPHRELVLTEPDYAALVVRGAQSGLPS